MRHSYEVIIFFFFTYKSLGIWYLLKVMTEVDNGRQHGDTDVWETYQPLLAESAGKSHWCLLLPIEAVYCIHWTSSEFFQTNFVKPLYWKRKCMLCFTMKRLWALFNWATKTCLYEFALLENCILVDMISPTWAWKSLFKKLYDFDVSHVKLLQPVQHWKWSLGAWKCHTKLIWL